MHEGLLNPARLDSDAHLYDVRKAEEDVLLKDCSDKRQTTDHRRGDQEQAHLEVEGYSFSQASTYGAYISRASNRQPG